MRTVKHQRVKRAIAKHKRSVSIPKWLECTWRREPCGKQNCPVCSLLAEERQKMTERGEAEEFILDVTDDLRYSIAEGFLTIIDTKNELNRGRMHARLASNRHSPRHFAFYRKLDSWHEAVHDVFDDGQETESMWTQSADAADLDWYVHVLLDYTHRQLEYDATHSRKESGVSVAASYTRQVILQVSTLVADRLNRLALLDSSEKGTLMMLTSRFAPFSGALAKL